MESVPYLGQSASPAMQSLCAPHPHMMVHLQYGSARCSGRALGAALQNLQRD